MKNLFALSCLALFTGLSACSSAEDSPGPVAGAPSGGMIAGGTAAGGSSATAGGPSGGAAGSATTAGSASGGAAGGSAGAGQSGGGGASAGASAGGGGAGGAAMGGEALYVAKCGACHGTQGMGGMLAPEIQHPVRDYSTWVVRNGRAMTTFPAPMLAVPSGDLSDAELTSIWDYLDRPAQPTTGQALYLDYCANCHGADAKGGPTQRNILNELGELKEMVRKGAHAGEFSMRREYMPALDSARLSDAEVDSIYGYVDGL